MKNVLYALLILIAILIVGEVFVLIGDVVFSNIPIGIKIALSLFIAWICIWDLLRDYNKKANITSYRHTHIAERDNVEETEMNREIKFRGKYLKDGNWIYGFLSDKNSDFTTIANNEDKGRYTEYSVNPDTVGQFTGLYDRNGKEIYEGDIVNIHDSHETCGVVEYRDNIAAFVLCREKVKNRHKGDGTDYQLYAGREKRYEIIGNIYDNPELLKESSTPKMTQEKEIQIGDIVEVAGEKYIAEEARKDQDCNCCDLMDFSNCLQLCGHCSSDYRKDGKDLLFKKIGGEK